MKNLWRLICDAKKYIAVAAVLFFLGLWLGFQYEHLFRQVIQQMLEQLKDAVDRITNANEWETALFIFQNNLTAALLMVCIGVLLFFWPMLSLMANGLAVGYVLKQASIHGVSPVEMFIYGILPHGILELTAVIMAAGIGSYLGLRLLKWLFGQQGFFSHLIGANRGRFGEFWAEQGKPYFMEKLKGVGVFVISLVIVLFVAALIETYITPVLIEKYMDL